MGSNDMKKEKHPSDSSEQIQAHKEILTLLKKVTTVSVDTMKIIREIEKGK